MSSKIIFLPKYLITSWIDFGNFISLENFNFIKNIYFFLFFKISTSLITYILTLLIWGICGGGVSKFNYSFIYFIVLTKDLLLDFSILAFFFLFC